MKIYAVVVAGGRGSRMGTDIPKQYMEIHGKPLLYYTLKAFEDSCVDGISLVVAYDRMQYAVTQIVDKYGFPKVISICEGGRERFYSVLHALDDLSGIAQDDDIVLIQDGARPFVTADLIREVAEAVQTYGAAIAAVPAKDTIKIADADGFVAETTVRANTWQIQTPQGFRYGEIHKAYRDLLEKTASPSVTDDSQVFELAFPEKKVKLVKASYDNIKITTPEEFEVAKERL